MPTEAIGEMNRPGERVLLPGDTEAFATRPSRREAWWSVLATIAAVIVVHGVDLRYRLVFDDYHWLKNPPSGLREILRALLPTTIGAGVYRPFLALWFGAI